MMKLLRYCLALVALASVVITPKGGCGRNRHSNTRSGLPKKKRKRRRYARPWTKPKIWHNFNHTVCVHAFSLSAFQAHICGSTETAAYWDLKKKNKSVTTIIETVKANLEKLGSHEFAKAVTSLTGTVF